MLTKVGELLQNDKRITDETFRQFLRGDEFMIVANDTNLTVTFKAAEHIRKLIEDTKFVIDNKTFSLIVSCGVTEYKSGGYDFDNITEQVNVARIDAKKHEGKNCSISVI